LGNKIDIPTAASEEELREAFGLQQTYGKVSPLLFTSLYAHLLISKTHTHALHFVVMNFLCFKTTNVKTKDVRPVEVFMCSVVKRQGYKEDKRCSLSLSFSLSPHTHSFIPFLIFL
jgi:hypothetical protein